MSYNDRKSMRGQEFVEEIDIFFNACRYSVGSYASQNIISTSSTYNSSYTGSVSITTAGSWATLWAAVPGDKYAVTSSGEILKITITSGVTTSISVTARRQFGSVAESFTGQLRIIHSGEADGSCRGYSQKCKTPGSYSATAFRTLRFCTAPKQAGEKILPGLHHKSISYESAEIDVGESVGSPASLKFKIQDFVGGDDIAVPYEWRRSNAGTFWGRMLSRNPYLNGRKVIYRSGYRDAGSYSQPDYVEKHFIIDSFKHSKGEINFSCLDPIILTEEKKARMPVTSPAQTAVAIDDMTTSFSYINAPDYYFGPLSSEIFIRIDSEVIKCEVTDAKQLTIISRAYKSVKKDHDAGATIQDCIRLADVHVVDAITFALENFTEMPSDYIGDYSAVIAKTPTAKLNDSIITKPMSVLDFISAMIKIGNLIFYFDESQLKIVIDYIPEIEVQPVSINETEHIRRGSVSINENTKEQYTRFNHLWAPANITSDADENFSVSYLAANVAVESKERLGEVNEKKAFKNIFLNSSPEDSLLGSAYASRVVSGADSAPVIVTANVNAEIMGASAGGVIKLGAIASLMTKERQDDDGIARSDLYQIVKITGNEYEDFDIKMRRYVSLAPDDIDFLIDTGGVNFDLSEHYKPSSAGKYTVYINPGVEFGSNDTSIPAFTTGSQNSGVEFKIIIRGSILGMGGAGGDAGIASTPHKEGEDGGIAFEATVPCEIDCGAGIIWAGGGGGSGEYYVPPQGPGGILPIPRRGGGGGQGFGTSLGGRSTNGVSFSGRSPDGNRSSPGVVDCPPGGAWGEPGSGGSLPGEAIKSNGNSVTIIAGNNDFNIRGRRT